MSTFDWAMSSRRLETLPTCLKSKTSSGLSPSTPIPTINRVQRWEFAVKKNLGGDDEAKLELTGREVGGDEIC